MKNLILIGMPGCGKSTVARGAARRLGCGLYDCDQLIEEREGMSIPELFAQRGEEYFREVERRVMEGLRSGEGAVIAAGGGAVLRCAALMRQKGFVLYLRRSVQSILETLDAAGRPLLAGAPQNLLRLYEQRAALYEKASDGAICNERSAAEAVEQVAALYRRINGGEGAS